MTRTDRLSPNSSPLTTSSHVLPLNSDPRSLTYSVVAMAARCSFLSTPAELPSVPSGIAQGQGPQQIVSLLLSDDVGVRLLSGATLTCIICLHIQNLRPTPITHVVEPEGLRNPYPLEEDLFGMDFFPSICVMERLIGSTPAAACPTGNYFGSPSPFLEDVTTDAFPPPSSLLMPPTSLPSPDDHIPRACHGVERRQRSRPSSRGGADYLHFSKLTRHERATHKTAASRRVAFAEPTHQFASSSLWISADDPPPSTATATGKLKRRPPTPRYTTSFDIACSSLDDDDERDASPGSPGFDADVEFDAAEEAQRSREQVGDQERLTIIVPGGKSEAYVAMAFERSCSLSTEDEDDCPSSADHQSHDVSDTNEKTGLKIRIPVPNPLFMLSLRLASSCRVSDEEEKVEVEEVAAAHTDDDDDGPPQSQSGMNQDQERDRDPQNRLNTLPIRAGRFFASSRSPTPPVAPPSSPAPPGGRAERRVARRAALAPYCAIDRLHAVHVRESPCLSY
jgi:hypothetical protein